jgi:valyl-tRNA synthetase
MTGKFKNPYNPQETEARIYELWEKSGFFNPDNLNSTGEKFSMVMPPTNANGDLHAGHALVMTIEDILTRYKRMRGFKTLWLPGNDHAGFETQVVYEKKLEKEGRSRFGLEPSQLYDEIMAFTQANRSNINSQIRKLGASCDWSREKFTLDEDIIETVYSTFRKLSEDGLLYRGARIISWCPKHQTSFSDLEILDEERIDKFYYLKYGPFTIGTSRPETKFGDKYVVMHPDDPRYMAYAHGQKIKLKWINGPIEATIIKDAAVDQQFGSGVMTITPWHDAADFAIAERHGLEKEQIIDWKGKLLPIAGEFAGMHISKAREDIINKLQSKGLVEKIDENYKHTIRTCYKCGTVIEPQIKPQWFVKMRPLASVAQEKINSGEVRFIPEHYKKIVLHWLNNVIDWNISRQIVWGIPIPAKICDDCGAGEVDLKDKLQKCSKCEGSVHKDPDTFDTWFSSGQWPFAALGYPQSQDYADFYPTDILETAGEIIFFWVARMIMLGLYTTGKAPFNNVYLHGLVLDEHGRKMSKSKGNVINPLDITAKYGTDAVRIGLIIGNTPGTSLALSENQIKGYKHFANKIWNATRFVIENTSDLDLSVTPETTDGDSEKLRTLNDIIKEISGHMDNYRFYIAAEKIYHYFWHTFADVIIEECKARLKNAENPQDALSAKWTLREILVNSLKILHPFMPFITEEIWQSIPHKKGEDGTLMIEKWPN